MDRQEYIELLLDHYEHPRNRRVIAGADIDYTGGNPGCGDIIHMYATVDDTQRMTYETLVEELGSEVVAPRIKCAVLALGTLKAGAQHYRRSKRVVRD